MKVAIGAIAVFSSVVSANAEMLSVSKTPADPDMRLWELRLTATTEIVRVLSVDVNRGCQRSGGIPLPIDLKYGQEVWLGTFFCEPIEVKVDTSAGPQTLSWKLNVNGQLAAQKYRVPSAYSGNGYLPANVSWSWLTFIINTGADIEIESFMMNRGNCRVVQNAVVPETGNRPKILKFGQRFAIFSADCNPLELLLETSTDQVAFSWGE